MMHIIKEAQEEVKSIETGEITKTVTITDMEIIKITTIIQLLKGETVEIKIRRLND